MTRIPIWFDYAKYNFEHFFKEINYFDNKKIKILHLGAYTGHGTRWMLEHVDGTCIDVDTWEGSMSLKGHLDNHETYWTEAVEALYDQTVSGLPTKKFKGMTKDFFAQNTEMFEFIYIDASHKKADVAVDLEESWKILNFQGVIACDDYLWHLGDDSELIPHYAIKEFADSHAEEIEILIDNDQFWFKKV